MNYVNYHTHKWYTNPIMSDSPVGYDAYIDRALELNQRVITSVEHGWQGNYFELNEKIRQKNIELQERRDKGEENVPEDLMFVFGVEAYWVKDRRINVDKDWKNDGANCHMVILAKNENGRQEINLMLSKANEDGVFNNRPRVDFDLLFKLPKDDVFITSACLQYWKYEDIDDITKKFHDYFGDNFMLEVQNHNTEKQKELNRHILKLSKKLGIKIIAGMDSHYIDETKDGIKRQKLLDSKKIKYDDEEGWYLDYPSYKEACLRFLKQGVLTKDEIIEAMNNTNIILTFDDLNLGLETRIDEKGKRYLYSEIKLPTLYPEYTQEQKDKLYKTIIFNEWNKFRIKENIPKEEYPKYKEAIKYEVNEVIKTGMSDYFIDHYYGIKLGVEKYKGRITKRGRGSAVSYFTNTLLGFSKVDRLKTPIKLYPERFLTADRILKSRSCPDIDNNVESQEPFVKGFRELLGENMVYPFLAFGTLKQSSAIKMYMSAEGVEPYIQNNVTKQLDAYDEAVKKWLNDNKDDYDTDEDRDKALNEEIKISNFISKEYQHFIEESKECQGMVTDKKSHPCFLGNELVLTKDGYKEIKNISIGDYVFTYDGTYQQVLKIMNNESDDIYTIYPSSSLPIQTTGNHPFYVRKRISKFPKEYANPEWIRVDEIGKHDLVGIPVNKNSKIISNDYDLDYSNEDLWWIVGRYLGDGWITELNRNKKTHIYIEKYLVICCNKNNNELDDIIRVLKRINFNYRIEKRETVYRIYIKNKNLLEYLKSFGKYAYNKYIPTEVIDMPINLLESLLRGYLSADGCFERNGYISFKTVSKRLALGFIQIINKVYHRHCITSIIKEGKDTIEGRIVNRREKYSIKFRKEKRDKERSFYEDGYIWCPCKHINKIYNTKNIVYNLSVNGNNSYTVNNVAVHNCGHLLLNQDIRREIGLLACIPKTDKSKKKLCACIDGATAEHYKYLKTDLLIVDVVGLIEDVWKRIGKESITNNELEKIVSSEEGKKTWDIFKNGYTCCVNQCEKKGTKHRVMAYAPTNTAEISAFVAGVRPGFKSLFQNFIDRKPYSTGVPQLDEILKDSYHYLLYQESIMTYLNWLGIDMKETYDIVKKISKKVFKKFPEQMKELKNKLKPQWIKNTNTEEGFDKTFQVVDDSGSYAFNASHSYCVGVDGVEEAYLKAYYPYEFYECALNRYDKKKNKDKMAELKKEMLEAFGIREGEYKFRKDNRQFTLDKDNKCIYPCLSSIKTIGRDVSQQLYDLRNNKYNNFLELYKDIKNNTTIKINVIELLIKLDYFSEFGKSQYLLDLIDIYNDFGNIKVIKKDKIDKLGLDECIVKKYSYKETAKQYSEIDNEGLINYLSSKIKNVDIPLKLKIKTELDNMGYIRTIKSDLAKPLYFVLDAKEYNNKRGITAYVDMYNIKNGKEVRYKANIDFDQKGMFIDEKNGVLVDIERESTKPKKKMRRDSNGNAVLDSKGKNIYDVIPGEFNNIMNEFNLY